MSSSGVKRTLDIEWPGTPDSPPPIALLPLRGSLARHNGCFVAGCIWQVVGLCRHWGGLGSTSAMWRVVDGGGVEQLGDSFLHQRTHIPVGGYSAQHLAEQHRAPRSW